MYLYRIINKSLWESRKDDVYPENNEKFILINESQIADDLDNYWGGMECAILKINISQFKLLLKPIGNNSYEYTGTIPLDSIKEVTYITPPQKMPIKFIMHEVGHLSGYGNKYKDEYGDQNTFMSAYSMSTSHTKSNASNSSKKLDDKNSEKQQPSNQSDSKKLKHQM